MKKYFLHIILILLVVKSTTAQDIPYFPSQIPDDDWKVKVEAWAFEETNSSAFTNGFLKDVNDSKYLVRDLRENQIENINENVLTGRQRSFGTGVHFRSGKMIYYIGLEHQHVLDSRLDEGLIKILLLGNAPYAGEILQLPFSQYYSNYFNQLKGGIGTMIKKGGMTHSISGTLGLTIGQNYDFVKVENSSFYTHPDGDYLDVSIVAETELSDTAWAEVYEVGGIGGSLDLKYSILKEKDFYVSFSAKNLGFVNWSRNPFVAGMDTSFMFEGIAIDTTSGNNENIPDDFSYDNLRRLFFKNPDGSSFNSVLPVILNFTAGKYISEENFYIGLNAMYLPTLEANYKLELFATWNSNNTFQLTPIFAYSSYEKINFGLGFGVKLSDNLYLRAGSSYLNSIFSDTGAAGAGGYFSLVFVN